MHQVICSFMPFLTIVHWQLRKVAERVRPGLQKIEERDTLLEQIRAKVRVMKSFLHSPPHVFSFKIFFFKLVTTYQVDD